MFINYVIEEFEKLNEKSYYVFQSLLIIIFPYFNDFALLCNSSLQLDYYFFQPKKKVTKCFIINFIKHQE